MGPNQALLMAFCTFRCPSAIKTWRPALQSGVELAGEPRAEASRLLPFRAWCPAGPGQPALNIHKKMILQLMEATNSNLGTSTTSTTALAHRQSFAPLTHSRASDLGMSQAQCHQGMAGETPWAGAGESRGGRGQQLGDTRSQQAPEEHQGDTARARMGEACRNAMGGREKGAHLLVPLTLRDQEGAGNGPK